MLYIAGDDQHTQNIQINKVIGENAMSFILQKKLTGVFGQPNILDNSLITYAKLCCVILW